MQIKDPNFRTVQKQCTLKRATWLQQELTDHAMALIRAAVGYGASIRTLTVTAAGLVAPTEAQEQLDIFSTPQVAESKQETVEDTMAQIRERFGHGSIRLGCFENDEIGTGHMSK